MTKKKKNSYIYQIFRALFTALVIALICALIVGPLAWMWGRSIEKRRSLREAKNVVLNLELLCVEYYGREDMLFDDTRISGLSLLGEEEIRNTAEVKGEITMLVMDNVKQHVDGLNYRNEKYVVCYRSEPLEGEDKWEMYRRLQ